MNIFLLVDNHFKVEKIFETGSVLYNLNPVNNIRSYENKTILLNDVKEYIKEGVFNIIITNIPKYKTLIEFAINACETKLILFSNLKFEITNVNCKYKNTIKMNSIK